jgi:hypothetical protein
MLNYMKTKYCEINWLIPVLGVAMVAGCVMAAAYYVDTERKIHSAESLAPTLDNIYLDQLLSGVLKDIHDGDVNGAAQRLDLLLCGNILRLNAELDSADDRTRAYVEDAFRRIGRVRPQIPVPVSSASAPELANDQAAAQRILALAMSVDHAAK